MCPDEELPPAVAILNPKMPGSTYPCQHLSGCGVGFKFMQAFALSNGLTNHNELESLLDLVAVSIAADIVPIVDENRVTWLITDSDGSTATLISVCAASSAFAS